MKLFELFATLGLDTTKFENGVKKAGKGFNALKDGVFTAANGIANGANKIIDTTERFAGRAAIVVGSAATAFAGITIKAMSAAGELEQQVGGAAQVFGDYAAEIERWADAAFEFSGLSKYEYLQSANIMGSLLQGAGFGQDESLDLTTQVMQRAADVASIMGINTADAIYAVTGAAKGNFTMMDNLGVAMNATTIEAYALSKGTNKAYAEMTNLEKVGYAYQMFLEKTAYATGNYARENDTLVGSISTAKAAMKNFISGSGSAADVVKFVKNAGKVISKNLTLLLPTFITGLSEMLGALAPELPALMEVLLPSIFDGANILIGGLVDVLPQLMRSATSSIPVITGGLQRLITGMLGGAPQFLEAASALFNGLMDGFMQLVPQIGALAGEIAPALLAGIVTYKGDMLLAGLDILKNVMEGFSQNPEKVFGAVKEVVSKIETWITENSGTLKDAGLKIVEAILSAFTEDDGKASTVVSGIGDALSDIGDALEWIAENIALPALKGAMEFLSSDGKIVAAALEAMAIGFSAAAVAAHPFATAIVLIFAGLSKLKEMSEGLETGANYDNFFKAYSTEDLHTLQTWIDAVNAERTALDQMQKAWDNGGYDNPNMKALEQNILDAQAVTAEAKKALDDVDGLLSAYNAWRSGQAENVGKDLYLDIPLRLMEGTESELQSEVDSFDIDAIVKGVFDGGDIPTSIDIPVNYFSYNGSLGLFNRAIPKASGLPYVPYNEFPAMLHAGEAVLTRQEAEGWRSGQGGTVDAEAIASAVARAVTNALDGAAVTMSGQAVGNLVTDTVSRNIARAARRKGLATV